MNMFLVYTHPLLRVTHILHHKFSQRSLEVPSAGARAQQGLLVFQKPHCETKKENIKRLMTIIMKWHNLTELKPHFPKKSH